MIKPDYSMHPGEIIQEIIEARGITRKELAKRSGLTEEVIDGLIKERGAITEEIASALERALDISAETWKSLDCQYSSFRSKKKRIMHE
jgi:addiction module HigA family antidote